MGVSTTPNMGFKIPDMSETISPDQYNYNFNLIDEELPKSKVLNGTTPPTTSTVGVVGQFYLDTATKDLYQCVAVDGGVYNWENVIPEHAKIAAGSYTGNSDNQTIDIGVSAKLLFVFKPGSHNLTNQGSLYDLPLQHGVWFTPGTYFHISNGPYDYGTIGFDGSAIIQTKGNEDSATMHLNYNGYVYNWLALY